MYQCNDHIDRVTLQYTTLHYVTHNDKNHRTEHHQYKRKNKAQKIPPGLHQVNSIPVLF